MSTTRRVVALLALNLALSLAVVAGAVSATPAGGGEKKGCCVCGAPSGGYCCSPNWCDCEERDCDKSSECPQCPPN